MALPNAEKLEASQPKPFRYTVEAYERAYELGVFGAEARVELIDGEVYQMPSMGDDHYNFLARLNMEMVLKLHLHAMVINQSPLRVKEDDSLPEPDIVVIPKERFKDKVGTWEEAVLVMEVSDSTLEHDRGRKLRLYARNSISEVWIVNVKARQLEVYREPEGEEYRSKQTYDEGREVAPLAFPDTQIKWW